MEGKQFITRKNFLWLHFIQNINLHLGEEVVPMPAKKKKTARKSPKRKSAKKAVRKTTKRKAAKRKPTSKKKKKR